MNVWKNVPDEKNGFTKRSSTYYSIWNYTIDILCSGTIFKSSVAGPSTSKAEAENILVYKIPYRRARAWPSGCSY